jgi:hypothetical protein
VSTDILVLLEHHIDDQWVLVDVDPHMSADRNSTRLLALQKMNAERPANLSAGTKWWLSDGATKFLTALSLAEAVDLWLSTESDPRLTRGGFHSLALSYFGCWEVDPVEWRIVVGCL